MATAHRQGIALRDTLALVATESTPGTLETFASDDYLIMTDLFAQPSWVEITESADTGAHRGGFERSTVLPGTSYIEVVFPFHLRYPTDADDGPPQSQLALFNAAMLGSTIVAVTSHTLAPDPDPTVIEAARISCRFDEQGAQYVGFGGLIRQLVMQMNTGGLIQCTATGWFLLDNVYAAAYPAEQDPVSRTPAVTFSAGADNTEISGTPSAIIIGEAGITPETDGVTVTIENTLVAVRGGGSGSERGRAGIIQTDQVVTAQTSILRPLQASDDLIESFFDDNNSTDGTTFQIVNTDGTRTMTTNFTNAQQLTPPGRSNNQGLRYYDVNLRSKNTGFNIAFT